MTEFADIVNQYRRAGRAAADAEKREYSTGGPRAFSPEEINKALDDGQDGDAGLFVQIYRERFCFDHAAGAWYRWAGHYWEEDRTEEALAAVNAVAEVYEREGERRKLDAGRVKFLTGGDTLVGRAPYGRHEVNFNPTHTLFLLTNFRPRVDAGDFAMWARIHLISFKYSFVDNPDADMNQRQRDPQLLEKLKAEASGILAWLVRGCLKWQKQGLDPPEAVKAATDRYKQEEDKIGQFVNERCSIVPGARVTAGAIRKAYENWYEENSFTPVSGNKFSTYLLNRFHRNDTGRHRLYEGIGLSPE